jgi:hypothetical protein
MMPSHLSQRYRDAHTKLNIWGAGSHTIAVQTQAHILSNHRVSGFRRESVRKTKLQYIEAIRRGEMFDLILRR